jgi:hypothetical protein
VTGPAVMASHSFKADRSSLPWTGIQIRIDPGDLFCQPPELGQRDKSGQAQMVPPPSWRHSHQVGRDESGEPLRAVDSPSIHSVTLNSSSAESASNTFPQAEAISSVDLGSPHDSRERFCRIPCALMRKATASATCTSARRSQSRRSCSRAGTRYINAAWRPLDAGPTLWLSRDGVSMEDTELHLTVVRLRVGCVMTRRQLRSRSRVSCMTFQAHST